MPAGVYTVAEAGKQDTIFVGDEGGGEDELGGGGDVAATTATGGGEELTVQAFW